MQMLNQMRLVEEYEHLTCLASPRPTLPNLSTRSRILIILQILGH